MGMGSYNRKHLSSDEIEKFNRPALERIFNVHKNSDGVREN
jgi:hypothetical protein